MSEEDYSGSEEEEELEELHVPRMHDEEEGDSDKELQIAFQSGLLKQRMVRRIDAPPPDINNKEGLLQKLEEISQSDLDWVERLDVTIDVSQLNKDKTEDENFDVHNDFKREVFFYEQAKAAVMVGMEKLHSAGIKTKRPDDYFCEMAKKDTHMKKVRSKLLSIQKRRSNIEKNVKNMKLKKYGKKVQQAVTLERQKKKKEMLNNIKKYQKGKTNKLDFLDETSDKKLGRKQSQLQKLQQAQKTNPKRSYRDKKFGFGGRKKGTKGNTKASAHDTSGFKSNVHSKKQTKASNKRPGKNRRVKSKSKK